ncbi:DUF6262 family protein [Streptomyces sp. NPDC048255]|uniref:DUF6262 family protein n=1 Tax=Streptomyces sp. NPDC048255 TaxID=3154713 RepID=UPI0033F52127
MSPLPQHLQTVTRARSEGTAERARAALSRLVTTGKSISFTAVAREAAVSTDFLYRHQELRVAIERHRAKRGQAPVTAPDAGEPSSTSAAVRALSARLSQQQQTHRNEVAQLRKALEVAQGENLELRRRLAQFTAQ